MIKIYYSHFKNLNQFNYNCLKKEFDDEFEKEKKNKIILKLNLIIINMKL